MNAKRLLKQLGALLVLAVLVGGAFLIGRTTGSGSEATGQTSSQTGEEGREVLYWQSPMNPTEIYDEPGKSVMGMDLVPVYADEDAPAQAGAGNDREVLYWQSPMNPTEIYDEPGKSVMGMDLVPVYADGTKSRSSGTVSIDPAVVQNTGVRVAPAERLDFTRVIRTVGKVEYNEETLHTVNTKISGWIEKLHVAFTGEAVEKGDPLLEIYSPDLVTTQQEYLLALRNWQRATETNSPAAVNDAKKLLQSTKERLLYWDVPPTEIERLERTGEVKKTVLLKSPATGIVIEKTAIEGAYIMSGMDLYEIADLSTVWVHASVYDNELPWIDVGQEAKMELSYQPGKVYSGRLSYIYPYLRDKARDVHARLVFPNPDLALKPGMYVNVVLQGNVIPDAIAIPTEAVIRSGERTIVFVTHSPGKFEPREVLIGEEGGPGGSYVRVISGLDEGEIVVISAQFMLDSESRLQEAIQKMLDGRAQSTSAGVDGVEEDMEGMDHGGDGASEPDAMEGMDHGGDGASEPDAMKGMDHGGDGASEPDAMKGMDHGDGEKK